MLWTGGCTGEEISNCNGNNICTNEVLGHRIDMTGALSVCQPAKEVHRLHANPENLELWVSRPSKSLFGSILEISIKAFENVLP